MDKNNKIEAMMMMVMRQKAEEESSSVDDQPGEKEEEVAVNLKKRSRSPSSETETINNQSELRFCLYFLLCFSVKVFHCFVQLHQSHHISLTRLKMTSSALTPPNP